MIEIRTHAILSAIDRLPGCDTEEKARALLTSPAILLAAEIGAKYVRLGSGHRVVIEDGAVITVLPREIYRGTMGSGADLRRQECRGAAMAKHYEEGY